MFDEETLDWIISLPGILTISGVLLALIGITLALKFKKRRVLRYSVPFRSLIFSNRFIDIVNFDLRLNNKPVRDLFAMTLIIENIGNEVLYEKDFLSSLQLTFNKEVNIFPVKVVRKNQDIKVSYEYGVVNGKSFFKIKTKLIEPNDVLQFNILYESDEASSLVLNGRIINGKIKYRYKFSYEETSRDSFRSVIAGRYKNTMRSVSFGFSIILLLIINNLIKNWFPNLYADDNSPWYLILIYIVALLWISMTIAAPTVLLLFKIKINREIKENEEYLEKRRKKMLDEAEKED